MDDNEIQMSSVDNQDPADPKEDSNTTENEQLLTESSRLAYVKLCAVILQELYSDDLGWCKRIIKILNNHLNIAESDKDSINKILLNEEPAESKNSLMEILHADNMLQNDLTLIVQDLIGVGIQNACYDARYRVFIRQISWTFLIPWFNVELFEQTVLKKTIEYTEAEGEEKRKLLSNASNKAKRFWIMGVAGIGGGIAVFATGGLAAPLIAAGGGALLASASAPVLDPAFIGNVLTTLFGNNESHLTNFKTTRRLGISCNCEFEILTIGKELHYTIAVSGYLGSNNGSEFYQQWSMMYHSKEQYLLKWETEALSMLGSVFQDVIEAATNQKSKISQEALLPGLSSLASVPILSLKAAEQLDKPWKVCTRYARKAGKHLAVALIKRIAGIRPVSLIGFSSGALVICHCLDELMKEKNNRGIIENVFLLGAPIERDSAKWEGLMEIIAGKLVNGYCHHDYILQAIFQSSGNQSQIAGLSPIVSSKGRILNINLSEYISNHLDYASKLEEILELLVIPTAKSYSEQNIAFQHQAQLMKEAIAKAKDELVAKRAENKSEVDVEKESQINGERIVAATRLAIITENSDNEAEEEKLDKSLHEEAGARTNSGSQDDQLKKCKNEIAKERLENKSKNGLESESQINSEEIATATTDNLPEAQDEKLDKSVHEKHDKAINSDNQDDQLPVVTTSGVPMHDTPGSESTPGEPAIKHENSIAATDHDEVIASEALANDATEHNVQKTGATSNTE